jgi:GT2 family glycosyltransferase
MNSYPELAIALLYHSNSFITIKDTLDSIIMLDYPKKKLHLLLIDNMSDEKTKNIVINHVGKYIKEYASCIIITAKGNVPTLRNLCIDIALLKRLKLLFFVDSDVILKPKALKQLIETYNSINKENDVFIVSLPYLIPFENETIFYKVREKYGKSFYKVLKDKKEPFNTEIVGMGATLINLNLINYIGYFNGNIPYIEDVNLTQRAVRLGYKVIMDPRLILLHNKKTSTLNFLKRQFKMGSSEVLNIIKNKLLKKEIKSLTYWTLFLASLIYVVITPIPFIILTGLGWFIHTRRFHGIGKIIGFPVMAIYRTTRLLSIYYGLLVIMCKTLKANLRIF